jgi:hypothetical protein
MLYTGKTRARQAAHLIAGAMACEYGHAPTAAEWLDGLHYGTCRALAIVLDLNQRWVREVWLKAHAVPHTIIEMVEQLVEVYALQRWFDSDVAVEIVAEATKLIADQRGGMANDACH